MSKDSPLPHAVAVVAGEPRTRSKRASAIRPMRRRQLRLERNTSRPSFQQFNTLRRPAPTAKHHSGAGMEGPSGPPTQQPAGQNTSSQRVRRLRTARACDACRLKKNRCDDAYPCSYCRRHGIECTTMGQVVGGRPADSSYVKALEDQVRQLRAQHERSPADRTDPPLATGQASLSQQSPQPQPQVTTPGTGAKQEVSGVNQHTRNVEFYGSSSAVALLSHVESAGGLRGSDDETANTAESDKAPGSIVSSLHNPAFSPAANGPSAAPDESRRATPALPSHQECRVFVLNFFNSIHYIHPILSKAEFLARCDDMVHTQSTQATARNTSFDALYYAIVALGSLVGPRDDEPLHGRSNLEWSRIFFNEAVRRRHELGMVTDLEMVQCYFILAKVCQNELNPHLAYMYIGLAARTALAMGINREPRSRPTKAQSQLAAETRTWWGLYSLEVEMSFSMGRPDTLGADLYHNRHFPRVANASSSSPSASEAASSQVEPAYCAIIKAMVDLSRIIKSIGLEIYLSDEVNHKTVETAFSLQNKLDEWTKTVPGEIRPRPNPADLMSLKSAKDPQWIKRQRLVITLRYLNLKILVFGSFLLPSSSTSDDSNQNTEKGFNMMQSPDAQRGIEICIASARSTIEIIFMMYQHHDFFRTWFYNTTYVSFAASIILVYVTRVFASLRAAQVQELLQVVSKATEILETMDECIVALKSAKLLRSAIDRAAQRLSTGQAGGDRTAAATAPSSSQTLQPPPSHGRESARANDGDHSSFAHGMPGSGTAVLGGVRQLGTPNEASIRHSSLGGTIHTEGNAMQVDLPEASLLSSEVDPGLMLNHYWGPLNLLEEADYSSMAMADFSFQFDELDGGGGLM